MNQSRVQSSLQRQSSQSPQEELQLVDSQSWTFLAFASRNNLTQIQSFQLQSRRPDTRMPFFIDAPEDNDDYAFNLGLQQEHRPEQLQRQNRRNSYLHVEQQLCDNAIRVIFDHFYQHPNEIQNVNLDFYQPFQEAFKVNATRHIRTQEKFSQILQILHPWGQLIEKWIEQAEILRQNRFFRDFHQKWFKKKEQGQRQIRQNGCFLQKEASLMTEEPMSFDLNSNQEWTF